MDSTPTEILQLTSEVVIDDSDSDWFVLTFNKDQEKLANILITPTQSSTIIEFILDNYDNISVYQSTKDNLILPSRQKLYEAIYL
jgi:hypothetical protein